MQEILNHISCRFKEDHITEIVNEVNKKNENEEKEIVPVTKRQKK